MEKTIFDHIAIFIFRKFQYTRLMALNMAKPRHFILGNITKRLMRFGNRKMVVDSVDKLNVSEGDVVIEVGSGNGDALCELLKRRPKKIFALEISRSFLSDLKSAFSSKNIDIIERDAKDLKDIVENDSIDKILLINVVYFLDPIEPYLSEFKRTLKSGGTVLITGKFTAASQMDRSVFKNTSLEELLATAETYFDVESQFVDLGEPISQYHAIKLTKI